MRHRKAGYKLGRTTSHRNAMLRNMVTSLFEHERIVTTETRAKALKPMAEKLITLAKRGDLHARRQALSVLTKKNITHKLFEEIKDRYMDRAGGYTSIVRIGPRRGDCAEMAVLELIKPEDREKAKKKTKKKAKKKAEPAKAKATAKEKAAPAEEAKAEVEVKAEAPVETAPAEEAPAEEATAEEAPAEEEKAEEEEKTE